jgi:hypothetical protein
MDAVVFEALALKKWQVSRLLAKAPATLIVYEKRFLFPLCLLIF